MKIEIVVVVVILALSGCTHTASSQMADGSHCETTVHSYPFYAHVDSKCWDRNGNLLSSSEAH